MADHTASHASDAAGHSHHAFDFATLNASHNSPYPAIEPIHGLRPLIVLDKAAYAQKNLALLRSDPAFAAATPTPDDLAWATDVAGATAAPDLAKAMTLVDAHAVIAFPRALSFFNHQTFWSTVALLLMAVVLLVVARRRPEQVKPANRLQHIIESVVLFIRDDIARANIHHHADAWTPFLGGLFLMILTCNLFGMIPLFGTATSSIFVTASWAIPIAVLMLIAGVGANGPGFFLKLVPVKFSWNPMDLVVWLLLLVLEWASLIIKPCVLAIRLFANMLAGHTVLLVFACLGFIVHQNDPTNIAMSLGLGSFAWVVTVAFYFLELLVAFVQAYVFTLLSAVFIGSCLHPEH
jgi:F-type H+-transporting ATPase subunit a